MVKRRGTEEHTMIYKIIYKKLEQQESQLRQAEHICGLLLIEKH